MSAAPVPKLLMRTFCTPLLFALVACDQTTLLVPSRDSSADAMPDSDAEVAEDASEPDTGPPTLTTEAGVSASCNGHPCQCSNRANDDDDLEIDGFDGECTGPFDDDEKSFAVNDVATRNPNFRDCFYDDNANSNDDDCKVPTSCSAIPPSGGMGQGASKNCLASETCQERCLPRTPNGCDCFGCCNVVFEGSSVPIHLRATCNLKNIADSNACPRCTIATSCFNECGPCELCPGKTLADLPTNCANDAGLSVACGAGVAACSELSPCPEQAPFCSQGCCVPILYVF